MSESVRALAAPPSAAAVPSPRRPQPSSSASIWRGSRGFTLVELLVVVAVTAVLAGMLLPALQRARETAKGIRCIGNIRQLDTALLMYVDQNRDFFVPLAFGRQLWCGLGTGGRFGFSAIRAEGGLNDYLGRSQGIRACPSALFQDTDEDATNTGNGGYGYSGNLGRKSSRYPLDTPARILEVETPSRTIAFADTAGLAGGGLRLTQQHEVFAPVFFTDDEDDAGWGESAPSMHFRHSDRASIAYADGHAQAEGPPTHHQAGWGVGDCRPFRLGWFGGDKPRATDLFRRRKRLR